MQQTIAIFSFSPWRRESRRASVLDGLACLKESAVHAAFCRVYFQTEVTEQWLFGERSGDQVRLRITSCACRKAPP